MISDLRDYEHQYAFAASLPGLHINQASMLLCIGLTAANDPDGVAAVGNIHLRTLRSIEEKTVWVEYIRNAIAKAFLICSFPRSLNATIALISSIDRDVASRLATQSKFLHMGDYEKRGKDFFDRVYQQQSGSVESSIRSTNPDLWLFVQDGYSYVSDTTWMTEVDIELSVIVNLYTMDSKPQLVDHLKGARNVGVTQQQMDSVLEIAKAIQAMKTRANDMIDYQTEK